ncbi:MAG: O-antigen ligase family protein [Planctomycetota bacterium]
MDRGDVAGVDGDRLPRLLELTTLLTTLLVVVLRTFSGGQDLDSLETAVIDALIWFAVSLWVLRKFLQPSFSLTLSACLLPLALFLLCTVLAVVKAGDGGNGLMARTLAQHWVMESFLFILLLDLLSTRERVIAVLVALGACTAVVVLFAFYQWLYALDYFVGVMEAAPGLVERSTGENPLYQGLYWSRVRTMRVYGPHGAYPNTMAGFLVLLLPFLWWTALTAWSRSISRVRSLFLLALALGAVLVLGFTGSRGGMLAATLMQLLAFGVLLVRREGGRRRLVDLLIWSFSLALLSLGTPILLRHLLLSSGVTSAVGISLTLQGILWSGGILLLAHLFLRRDHCPAERQVRFFALGGLLAALGLGAVLLLAPERAPHDLAQWAQKTEREFRLGTNTPGVRWNYWRTGMRMVTENPWRGVGLDQFGVYYPTYKTMEGWAVKRAHNQYIQLAADGGIPLLLAWLGFWCVCLRRTDRGRVLPAEVVAEGERRPSQLYLAAIIACGVVAILMTYFKYNGFHIEFFFNEVGGGPASRWPAEKGPALIHLLTHLLFLPVGGVLAAIILACELFSRERLEGLGTVLKLGVLGLLIHLFFDFHHYVQVISTCLLVVAGCALAMSGLRRVEFSLSRFLRTPLLLIAIALLGAAGWRGPLAQWIRAELLAGLPYTALEESPQSQLLTKIKVLESILEASPDDSATNRKISEFYMKLCRLEAEAMVGRGVPPERRAAEVRRRLYRASRSWREAAAHHARVASNLVPAEAAGHAFLARTLVALFPQDEEKRRESEERFVQASGLSPYKVSYLHWLGSLAFERGDHEAAQGYWERALALDKNPRLTDERARLSAPERRDLEARLASLKNKNEAGR